MYHGKLQVTLIDVKLTIDMPNHKPGLDAKNLTLLSFGKRLEI